MGEETCGVAPGRRRELAAQGWQRRFVADEPRLSEAAAQYRALGLEVLLEPFDPAARGEGQCTTCFDDPNTPDRFKIIYTRPAGDRGGEDLF